MKFYNKTDKPLEVKGADGSTMLGPFLPGTADKGPWYDVSEVSDFYFEKWLDEGKIVVVE